MIETIIFSTSLLLILVLFILLFALEFKRKRIMHAREKEALQMTFKQELLKSQLEIQEQTFNDISQEIHDNVGQVLSLAKVQVNIIAQRQEIRNNMLDDVKNNITRAMTDLRDIAKSLNSDRIRLIGIEAAIAAEADRVNRSGILHVIVETEGEKRALNEQKKLILFRTLQESLQNILKHADATLVTITFRYFPGELGVVVQDNGKGFDPIAGLAASTGLGLSNIRTRCLLIGGSSELKSELNKGTTLTINIPYE